MKYLPLIFLIFAIACNNTDENDNSTVPDCIQDILDDPTASKNLQTIRVQEVNNELHYWLNTGFNAFDAPEYIINNQCDTICTFCGFCAPPECTNEYQFEDWIELKAL